jgi:hypothetical protein
MGNISEICLVGVNTICGRMDRLDEADSHFSQLICKCVTSIV